MKKIDFIATIAVIALSVSQVIALDKLNIDEVDEMTPQIQTIIKQELDAKIQERRVLPNYEALNQMFIEKLEKAAAESCGSCRRTDRGSQSRRPCSAAAGAEGTAGSGYAQGAVCHRTDPL